MTHHARLVSSFLLALVVFGLSAVPSVAATRVDDFEANIIVAYSGNVDNTTQRKIFSSGRIKPTFPLVFSASRSKGTSTGSANLNAAVLFDGSRLSFALNPSTLVQQIRPINNKPAVLAVDFDEFELETDDGKPLQGLLFNDFLLVGTVAPGGYVKIAINLELDAEGPGTNIDGRRISVNRTFTSNFSIRFSELFGPKGFFGTDLSNRKIEELELEGILRFDALGTATGTTTLQVQAVP